MLTDTSEKPESVRGWKDSGKEEEEEEGGGEGERWYGDSKRRIPSIVITRGKSECRLKSRSRSRDDYGSGRGRGTFRGRGRREEDYFPRSATTNRPKSSNGSLSAPKYSNSNDNYSNKSDHGNYIGLPEDSRISATLRRMLREEDEDKFISLCKLLQDSLSLPDNTTYIRRSFDMILDNLLELLRTGPTNIVRIHTAKCLGRLGFNLEKDFKRFMDWIFNKYASEKDDIVRTYLMKGVLEATRLDDENRKLADFSQVLMSEMQQTMESTDVGEIFIATAEVILTLTKIYPETFTTHFCDTIDIIVGWHIDTSQPPSVTKFASRALKELAYFWRQDMSFTVSLLSQFLEDVENFGDELTSGDDGALPPHEVMDKIMSFVKVYNSVFKGLGKDMNPTINKSVSWTFLCESLTKVLMSIMKALELRVHQELLIAGNKCALSITNFLQSKTSLVQDVLCKYIFLQLEKGAELKINTAGTLLNLISRVVESLDMRLTEEMADKFFSPGSYLLSLRFTVLQSDVIQVYHSFLKLKNIPLLKKAYSHMMGDLEAALKVMNPMPFSIEGADESHLLTEYSIHDSQVVVLFYFRAISERAKKSNSLICMWLLHPSIFELLAVKLPPMLGAERQPELHYSLLVLLRSHCMRHQHYVLSSGLLNSVDGRAKITSILGVSQSSDNQMTISPSTSYLATVLTLLGDSLHQTMSEQSKLYVLSWTRVLLEKERGYLCRLLGTPELQRLLAGLCWSASDPCQTIALHAVHSIVRVLTTYAGGWPAKLSSRLMDLCVFYFNSTHPELREQYLEIITHLPAIMVVFGLQRSAMNPKSACRELFLNQYSHMISGDTGEMQTINFRVFMAYLLQGKEYENFDWLCEMVTRCWPIMESSHGVKALNSIQTLTDWAAWHAAQLCVDLKLRTPLGKPLETFIAIEGAIRCLAKETLSRGTTAGSHDAGTGRRSMTRVRLLVQFMEQLEKAIYNAAEGTSTAMQSVARPVKMFFLTNKSTCYEWMARIRLALLVVCLHCGLAASAVRHGYALLQTLLDNDNTQSVDFESTLLHVGWALAAIGEADAVQGLYVWSRDTARVRHPALKPLVDHAARRFEMGAEGYEALVKNNLADSPNRPAKSENDAKQSQAPHSVRTFIADQLTECYIAMTDWEGLEQWKSKEEEFLANENGSSGQRYKYIKPDYLGALRLFEREEFEAASSLLNWECANENEAKKITSWDCSNIIRETNHTLMSIAITAASQTSNKCWSDSIERCKKVIDKLVREGVRDVPSELLSEAALLKIVTTSLTGKKNLLDSPIPDNDYVPKRSLESPVMAQLLWWSYAINACHRSSHISDNVKTLSIEVAKSARREGNLKLARKALVSHLSGAGLITKDFRGTLEETATLLLEKSQVGECWTLEKAIALSELANQLHSRGDEERGMEMCVATILGLQGSEEDGSCERAARLLVKLVNWAQASTLPPLAVSEQLGKVLTLEGKLPVANFISDMNVYRTEEGGLGIGEVLRVAVTMWPGLADAWGQLGSWAWSRQPTPIVDVPPMDIPPHLLPHDVEEGALVDLLAASRPDIDPDDIEQVENSHTRESVTEQLRCLASFTEEQLEAVMDLWSNGNSKIYNFYKLSAYAYFKYLQICDPKEEGSLVGVLRVLRLVLRAAVELQGVLEEGLATTPTAPWVPIVPQLFARLDHPAPYARRRISDLLTRIGADSPHLITFQAVVGSHTGASTIKDMPQTKLFSTRRELVYEMDDGEEGSGAGGDDEDEEEELMMENDEEEADEDARSIDDESPGLENSFQAIVDALEKQSSEAISEVRLLVSELRRITLLWDELWLGTLSQHHSDISRRFLQLDSEVKATDANQTLSQNTRDRLVAEKHRLILKPLLFVLEQLNSITSVAAETPHEKWFQEKYGKNIEEVLRKMREPSNPRATGEAWHLLKELQLRLVARACKRSSYTLGMDDISPALAKLASTRIAMPGVPHPVTISSVVNYVAVLPTKTKPKKIVFNGSDGNTYTYLFKGLEDLHLDERIMQFLSIANTMLGGELRAHHYSVIPLGPRSGLISWVEDVTPIFSFYKRWQQREAANNNEATVMRPSDLYYSKLTPLLKEAGVAKVDPLQRKKWSVSVLKKVLVELMSSTPTYLLSKELWCHSANAGAWWQSTKLYSTSLAVMSVIGYIIGLGDRHLDNVLVNLQTGEVVHIDYNVCFEKGKTLRVPEKVPFRLTPNFRAALGVTGIEGIYRLTCEHVLEVLKKGRVTLLTLLEAFVYDPLIDWTPLNEAGFTGAVYGGGRELALETKQSRRELEKEVTCSMFAVRLTEAKALWLENRRLVVMDVSDMIDLLDQWIQDDGAIRNAQQSLQESHSQMAILKEAETQGNHSLYSLAQRYGKHASVSAAQQSAINALKGRVHESDLHLATYQVTVASIRGQDIVQWISEVSGRPKKDICLVFDLIKEFLQNAGQNQMVQQCIESEREMGELCAQETQLTLTLMEMLVQYGKISAQYPASYIHHHRASLYKTWATTVLSDMTPARCTEVIAEMKVTLSSSEERGRQASGYQSGLRRLVNEARCSRSPAQQSLSQQSQEPLQYHNEDPTPLLAVVLTALTALNKRFLMMEAAATSAGDRLVDLTSLDGDWFLEDMCLISGAAVTLSHLLPPSDNQDIQTAFKCLQHAHAQYKALQEMHINFTGIILGEALQALQFEEPSVLSMIDRLDEAIASINVSLPELINQLQLHLRFTVMGMKSPHEGCERTVLQLQECFGKLVSDGGPLSQGDMLLMGFHGLFTNLALGSQSLVNCFTSLQCPPPWKHVDQIREAKAFAVPIGDTAPRNVLDMMFFVKSVSAISDSLRLMVGEGKAFRGEAVGGGFPQDHMTLARPVRRFIADYISFRLLGVFSQTLAITICRLLQSSGFNVTGELEQKDIGANSKVPIEELCKKMVERRGLNTGGQLSEASGVVSAAEGAWRRGESEARTEREASGAQARLHRLQLAMTAHHWLHEHYLLHLPPPPISRAALMLELRKATGNLFSLQNKLKEVLEQQQVLVTSIEQRLKWACGANPALSEVMSAFEGSVNAHKEKVSSEQGFAMFIANMCTTVLQHEALRTPTSEALSNDAAFARLIEECEKSYYLVKNNMVVISCEEEGLVALLPPRKNIDSEWITKAEEIISETVRKLNSEMEPLQKALMLTEENVKAKATNIRGLMSKHHRIISDARALLKSMVKFEDAGLVGLEDYLANYKEYTETMSKVTKCLSMAEKLSEAMVRQGREEMKQLRDKADGIYEDLLNFKACGGPAKRPPLLRQATVCESPRKPGSTNRGVQERNAYAVSVWRRVKMKLEGRDPDPGVRSSVQQQVDWVISEATSLENLAVLYEGWTPWV